MRTFIQRKPSEQATSSKSAKSRQGHFEQRREVYSTLPIHSTIDNQTIPRKSACACGGHCPVCQARSSDVRISQPNDSSEIEADRIADSVMRTPLGERTPVTNSGNGGNTIQRKALASSQSIPSQNPAHVRDTIGTGGQPLDVQTQNFFAPRFGYDLSNVRVHTDSKAGQSARALDANAYTLGNNVVFGSGQYQPNSETGKRLIAHELAHVAQANSSSTIRRDTIYRQPAGNSGDLAAIEYEIQMLNMMPVKLPPTIVRLAQLEQMRIRLLAGGAGAPRANRCLYRKGQSTQDQPAAK